MAVYPRKKCTEKKNTKVCVMVEAKIKKLHDQGMNGTNIGKKLGLSQRTVWLRTADPAKIEKSKQKRRKAEKIRHSIAYKTDPEFKEKKLNDMKKFQKENNESRPEFREWQKEASRERYRQKKKK